MARRHITGFAFDLSLADGSTRHDVRIGNTAALLGDDLLGSCNGQRPKLTGDAAARKALMRARQSLVRDGQLQVLRSWDLPARERFEFVEVREVLACRPLMAGGVR